MPGTSKKPAAKSRRESAAAKAARAQEIIARLKAEFPEATTALEHHSPYELLVATILSAQCTDQRVNMVTPELFSRYRTSADLASADPAELEKIIRPTGFFRNKAKAIIGLGRALVADHEGAVPDTMEELVKLPGVGRKTANVVLSVWFGKPAIPVDTHVQRLVGRMQLSKETDPVKIELALQKLIPEADWSFASTALIWHGRRMCFARKPQCPACALSADCPFPAKR